MKLVLPYSVSANRYWVTFAYFDRQTKKPKAVTVPSAEAKAYKEAVGWIAKAAGVKEPTTKPVHLRYTLCPRTRKDGSASQVVLDLGNALKVAEDALQGIVYVNDRQVKKIDAEYGDPTPDGALVVEVLDYQPPPMALEADAA